MLHDRTTIGACNGRAFGVTCFRPGLNAFIAVCMGAIKHQFALSFAANRTCIQTIFALSLFASLFFFLNDNERFAVNELRVQLIANVQKFF
jgi:hypothetical protein